MRPDLSPIDENPPLAYMDGDGPQLSTYSLPVRPRELRSTRTEARGDALGPSPLSPKKNGKLVCGKLSGLGPRQRRKTSNAKHTKVYMLLHADYNLFKLTNFSSLIFMGWARFHN